jgi:TP901 family phage tail tape measure protein
VLRNASANIAKAIAGSDTGLNTATVSSVFEQIRNGGTITAPAGSELAKIASELTKVIGLYERLRQEKDRAARVNQNSLDQRLLSDRDAQEAEARIRSIQGRLRKSLQPDLTRLANIDPSLDISNSQKFVTLTRRIAELAQKSGLSQREVQGLTDRLNSGALTAADAKYARLLEKLQRLNELVNRAKGAANAFVGGAEPPFPGAPRVTGDGGLPPGKKDIANAKEYSGIYEKIRSGLEYFLVYKGFNFLTNQLQNAFENARKFQIQVSLIRTISQDAQQSVSETARQLISVSNRTGLDLNDVANAAYDAISNQVTRGSQTEAFLQKAGNLAKTTNASLQDSVNLLSSAINSYSLDVNDAEGISAKFFKTIDLGRIKAADLSNTFGRVAFTARDLGVDFDEVLAVLSTLTRQGITTDDAVTLLTNGINKLTNPTEKMTNLLKEFGFATPKAAVATLGFSKVMALLTEQVEAGRLEITDLFNEIRGEKYASAFKTFKGEIIRDLDEIKNKSLDTYRSAVDIRNESAGEQINQQINQLKNTLTTTFGSELTTLLKGLIDASGGVDKLASNITTLTRVVLIGGGAFVVYKSVMLGAGLATGVLNGVTAIGTGITAGATRARALYTGTTAASTTVTAANTVATGANTTAMGANRLAYVAHPIGLLLAAGGALYAYYQTQNVQIGEQNEKIQQLNDAYKEFAKTQKEVSHANAFAEYSKEIDKAESQLKRVGENIASDLAGANRQLDVAKDRATTTGSNLKEGFERYVNFMKDRISDVAREYNKFDDRVKNSAKNILNYREQARSQLYESQVKYSGGFEFDQFTQREKLLTKELQRLKSEITELSTKGSDAKLGPTDEDLQKAAQLGSAYLKLIQTRNDLREDRSQHQFDEDVKKNPLAYRPDKYGKVYRGVDTTKFEKEQNVAVDFLVDLENKNQERAKIQKDRDEKNILDRKENLLKAENAIKALDNIQIFDKGGDVSPEFKDKTTGRADIGKVREAFGRAANKAKSTLDPEALKKIGPEIDKLLGERIQALENEIQASQSVETLRKKQQAAVESTKALQEGMKAGREDIKKYAQDIETVTKNLDGLIAGLSKFTAGDTLEKVVKQGIDARNGLGPGNDGTSGRLKRGINRLPSIDDLGRTLGLNETPGSGDQAKAKLKSLRDEATSIQDGLKRLRDKTEFKDGIQSFDPKEVQDILSRIDALKARIKDELKKGLGTDQVSLPGIEATIPQLDALSDHLRESLRASGANFNQSLLNLNTLRSDTVKLTGDLNTTLDALDQIGPRATTSIGGAAKPFSDMTSQVRVLNEQLDATLLKLQDIKLKPLELPRLPVIPENPNQTSPRDTFIPPKQAFGGMLPYYAAGGPVGSDDRAVYAQAGEYIWNRTATRQFYSQIQAMNGRGRTPIEFHTTTGDTVNVGGVTINESKSGQSTASDVLRTIKRQQRRG